MNPHYGPYLTPDPGEELPSQGGGTPPALPQGTTPVLSPEDVQAMRAELAALRERDQVYQAERQRLDQLEQQFGQIRQVFQPSGTQDPTVEYFTNPQGHLARIKEEAKTEALSTARQERFWEGFYDRNPELEGMESFVLDTIRGNADLQRLAYTPASAKQLAAAVKARLAGIAGVQAQDANASGAPSVRLVEGGGGVRQQPATPSNDNQAPARPKGVGDLIRAQREARRKAAQGA